MNSVLTCWFHSVVFANSFLVQIKLQLVKSQRDYEQKRGYNANSFRLAGFGDYKSSIRWTDSANSLGSVILAIACFCENPVLKPNISPS